MKLKPPASGGFERPVAAGSAESRPQPAAPDRPLLVQQLQQAFTGLLQLGEGKREQAQVVVVLLLGLVGGVQPPADSAARVTGAQAVAGLLKVVTNQLALAGTSWLNASCSRSAATNIL